MNRIPSRSVEGTSTRVSLQPNALLSLAPSSSCTTRSPSAPYTCTLMSEHRSRPLSSMERGCRYRSRSSLTPCFLSALAPLACRSSSCSRRASVPGLLLYACSMDSLLGYHCRTLCSSSFLLFLCLLPNSTSPTSYPPSRALHNFAIFSSILASGSTGT